MVRRIPTIPIATVSGTNPQISMSKANWQHVEAAYGSVVAPEVRQHIQEAMLKLLSSVEVEFVALPAAQARKRIERIRKAAIGLRKVLIDNPQDDEWDARYYADRLIHQRLNDSQINVSEHTSDCFSTVDPPAWNDRQDAQSFLAAPSGLLIEACDQAIKYLEENPGRRAGDAWNSWVCRISEIVEAHQLPNAVAKITEDQEASPFVLLISNLQDFIPEGYRRSTFSKVALTEAITRARRVT
jgi:hypothetical protein